MKYYLIQRLTDHSYYSGTHKDFRGILYATFYDCEKIAYRRIRLLLEENLGSIFTIIPVYRRLYN